jgi:glycyl-tRNA synthetase beta chain
VLSQRPSRIDLVPAQAAAVKAFSELPEADTLAGATSESSTSCGSRKAKRRRSSIAAGLPTAPSTTSFSMFQKLQPIVDDRCARGDFAGALLALATAKPVVDKFFDDVLVMADDPAVRANRLALLRGVAQTMNRVADISKLAA